MKTVALALLLAVPCALAAESPQTPEATSLFGKPLVSAPPTGETKTRLEADLAKAQADYDRDPANVEAAIWRASLQEKPGQPSATSPRRRI